MDRWCGRTESDPCSESCDADVLRAPEIQHSVQHAGRGGHLARLSPVRLRTQPLTDDTLPARDINLHQRRWTIGESVIASCQLPPRRPEFLGSLGDKIPL